VTRARCSPPSSSARVGNRLGDVSHAVQDHVESAGSRSCVLVGHGIGRDMHEEPQVPNYGPPARASARGGHGARRRADGQRRPPHGPHGRRRLGDLLPGRLAGRPLRVHDRDHRVRPAGS
jgi:hypothetical protein